MGLNEEALELHKKYRGKIEIRSKITGIDRRLLALAYTPGVAEPCRRIAQHRELVYEYTNKWNFVAVVTDGTRVLGLGDIGPEAGLPVMEGKAMLFKAFGGVDAFPICLATKDPEEIITTVKHIAPVFGGINLEDITAPKCFYIEERLRRELDIPVFHDDQHGTAIVALAGLLNALRVVGKRKEEVRVVVNGAGAAGIAVAKLLLKEGFTDITLCDRKGALYDGRSDMNEAKKEIARATNKQKRSGTLKEILPGADVFIGLSAPGVINVEDVRKMADDAIVFAMANPIPEILPEEAKRGGARVVATGRSDFPNQVNNVLAFPGVFRGALDVRARQINEEMKVAAAYGIASLVKQPEEDHILPDAFDKGICPEVASRVAEAAVKSGVARLKLSAEEVRRHTIELLERALS
ncbi:MAG: NADP-dependent malic enzyme [Candidatus Micrarchaeia archaeon]